VSFPTQLCEPSLTTLFFSPQEMPSVKNVIKSGDISDRAPLADIYGSLILSSTWSLTHRK